jgi:hypothetical protein
LRDYPEGGMTRYRPPPLKEGEEITEEPDE